nr:MAG TPA: helix-turn-helix domain protein [Caudoviricetes sp.]
MCAEEEREGVPLYVSIAEAARIAGVSDEMMRAWANSSPEHIPYIQSGRKKLIRVAGIAAWAEKMEAA